MKISIITWPMKDSRSAHIFLFDFLKIIQSCSKDVCLITETSLSLDIKDWSNFQFFNIQPFWKSEKTILKILDDIIYQIMVCRTMLKVHNKINIIWIYGGTSLILPIVMARFMNKNLYVNVLGLESKRLKASYTGKCGIVLSFLANAVEQLSLRLTPHIVVESKSVIIFAGLSKFRGKTIANGARFIDIENFRVHKNYNGRENLVGYIGRLSCEKGIINFVEAILLMKSSEKEDKTMRFLIGGDGPLLNEIKERMAQNIEKNYVELSGWIPHNDLPLILNRLRLLVLPSYTEGLPTIILEAMACGTPVLATSVGGIPDVIEDGETGFLIDDNSPRSIANGIERALNHPGLDIVILNAKSLIEKKYGFESAINRYKKILLEV